MMFYRVEVKPSVEKDFGGIAKASARRIWDGIEALGGEPLPRGVVKLSGAENLYRIRIGDYRVIYGVDHAARKVLIHYVRHRREAYRSF